MPSEDPARRVRDHILEEHRDLVDDVVDAADAVVEEWDGESTTDRDAIVSGLEQELDRQGIRHRFPATIEDAVAAAGFHLVAPPTAAPPYVAVTSTGPVLRATVSTGRLVIALHVFEVERTPVRYRRRHGGVEAALDVAFVADD